MSAYTNQINEQISCLIITTEINLKIFLAIIFILACRRRSALSEKCLGDIAWYWKRCLTYIWSCMQANADVIILQNKEREKQAIALLEMEFLLITNSWPPISPTPCQAFQTIMSYRHNPRCHAAAWKSLFSLPTSKFKMKGGGNSFYWSF